MNLNNTKYYENRKWIKSILVKTYLLFNYGVIIFLSAEVSKQFLSWKTRLGSTFKWILPTPFNELFNGLDWIPPDSGFPHPTAISFYAIPRYVLSPSTTNRKSLNPTRVVFEN